MYILYGLRYTFHAKIKIPLQGYTKSIYSFNSFIAWAAMRTMGPLNLLIECVGDGSMVRGRVLAFAYI